MGASAAVAAILIKQQHIVEAFREAGATAVNTAATPASLGVDERIAFHKLRGHDVVREAGDGLFYLDEQAWDGLRQSRRRRVLVVGVVVLAAAITTVVIALR
ncbi:MAG: hypothetical protein ACYC3L_03905 [Gemmatimonadaceae bacterium]